MFLVKPSEILKVANGFGERGQPEKMANAAHLHFPIIFKVIMLDSHGIATLLSEVRFVTAVTAAGSVKFLASGVNFSKNTHSLCFYH